MSTDELNKFKNEVSDSSPFIIVIKQFSMESSGSSSTIQSGWGDITDRHSSIGPDGSYPTSGDRKQARASIPVQLQC